MIGPDPVLDPQEARRQREERQRRTIAKIQAQNAAYHSPAAYKSRDEAVAAADQRRAFLNSPAERAKSRAEYLQRVAKESRWLAEDEADAAKFAAAIAAQKQQRLRERGLI